MTHDESSMYLAVIKDLNKLIRKQAKAIDALMELHRPDHSIRGYRCNLDDEFYPCPTIQVIEKELA